MKDRLKSFAVIVGMFVLVMVAARCGSGRQRPACAQMKPVTIGGMVIGCQ